MKKILLFIVLLFGLFIEVKADEELEQLLNNVSDKIETIKESYENDKYVVGSIYMSTSSTNPSTLFGGTWEAYATGRTLIGAGSTYTVGGAGGSATATLTEANMPSHTHTYTASGSVASTFSGTNASVNTTAVAHTHVYYMTNTSSVINYTVGTIAGAGGFAGRVKWQESGVNRPTYASTADHSHTLTASGTVTSTFSGTNKSTSSKGSGTSFSVLNPYITVYIWRKTG